MSLLVSKSRGCWLEAMHSIAGLKYGMTVLISLDIIFGSRMVDSWFGMSLYLVGIFPFWFFESREGVNRLVTFKVRM